MRSCCLNPPNRLKAGLQTGTVSRRARRGDAVEAWRLRRRNVHPPPPLNTCLTRASNHHLVIRKRSVWKFIRPLHDARFCGLKAARRPRQPGRSGITGRGACRLKSSPNALQDHAKTDVCPAIAEPGVEALGGLPLHFAPRSTAQDEVALQSSIPVLTPLPEIAAHVEKPHSSSVEIADR